MFLAHKIVIFIPVKYIQKIEDYLKIIDEIEKIRTKTDSKYISVAHHKDDDIETYFINLIRGSGIRGFLGMKERKNKIIRPLLNFERNEIESYLMLKNQEFELVM